MANQDVQVQDRVQPQMIRGRVVSDKMDKTRVIVVKRGVKHKLYHKPITRNTRFKIHDEKNESKNGDLVSAVLCRPLSKGKTFRLKEILEKGAEE